MLAVETAEAAEAVRLEKKKVAAVAAEGTPAATTTEDQRFNFRGVR